MKKFIVPAILAAITLFVGSTSMAAASASDSPPQSMPAGSAASGVSMGLSGQGTQGTQGALEGEKYEEPRLYPSGTEEDYRSLLTLKTNDYQSMSVADFNLALLDWSNANPDTADRLDEDRARGEHQASLTEEELAFIQTAILASNTENSMVTRSYYSGKPKEDPIISGELYEESANSAGYTAYCRLLYQFSYHISDEAKLTVGERDRCFAGVRDGVQQLWEKTGLETLLTMNQDEMAAKLRKIAEEYSSDQLTIRLEGGPHFLFEHADERDRT